MRRCMVEGCGRTEDEHDLVSVQIEAALPEANIESSMKVDICLGHESFLYYGYLEPKLSLTVRKAEECSPLD